MSTWPHGGGEMAARIRAFDWGTTPLGPAEGWPDRLKLMVELVLASPIVSTLVCGPDRLLIYNDAVAPLYGDHHPAALGRPLPDTFPAGWATVAPFYARAFAGETVRVARQPLDTRGAGTQDIFDAILVPVRDADGRVRAVHMTGFEIGERLRAEDALRRSEERQDYLLTLSDTLSPIGNAERLRAEAMRVLRQHLGIDRAAYVEADPTGRLVAAGSGPAEGRFDLAAFGQGPRQAFEAGRSVVVRDTADLPAGSAERRAWEDAGARSAAAVPIIRDGRLAAVLAVSHREPRTWSPGDLAIVEETAERVWTAAERARADAALRESTQRFRALVTAGTYSIYRMSPDWRLMYHLDSRSLATTDEPIEDWVDKYIPAEDRPRVAAAIERAIRTRSLFELEHRVLLADGSVGWVLSRAVPLLDPAGEITEWFGAGSDVTDRRAAAEKLRESEERFQQFSEATPDILWGRNAETLQWDYLSPAFEDVYGLSRGQALAGNDLRRWLELIVPDDRPGTMDCMRRSRRGERVSFEYRIRRPDTGEVRWLRNTDFPIRDAAGRVRRVGGISQDITGLKAVEAALTQSEQRLRTLVEGVPLLAWRAVDSGDWTWASPQWAAFTGQSESDSHGFNWLEPLHPDDRAIARTAWSDAAEAGGFTVEYRIRNASTGDYRWFQTRAAPVRDAAGRVVEWLGSSTDVHDLRTLQERQAVLVAELQHRTRNLMGVVRATMDATLRSSTDLAGFGHRFRDRIDTLARVQGLLSRLSGVERVTFDELIRGEITAVGGVDGPKARVTFDGPPGVALRSSTVQTFALALHELATNAVKYGALGQPSGRLAVTWRLERAGPGGRPWLHVDWRESGVSMPAADAGPRGTGQGRQLIERALPYQLGARTTYVMGADGVRCSIAVPVSSRTAAEETADGRRSAS